MKRIVIILALMAGALAAACGGNGGGSPTPSVIDTGTPSRTATATPKATTTATAPTASATPSPSAPTGAGEIAYILQEEGNIWVVNADGGGQRRLTEGGQCTQAAGPFWSRLGDKIACVSGGTEEAPHTKVAVFNLEGQTLAQPEHEAWVGSFAWSADDRHFIYSIGEGETRATARVSLIIGDAESDATIRLEDSQDPRWSPDGTQLAYLKTVGEELTIYDLASGQDKPLGSGLRPLAWALEGKALLVAADYQQQDIGVTYEASLLDLASGATTRVPELDNGAQFWLSRDGQTAAFLVNAAERPEGGMTISVLDLASLKATPIEGAVIGYPSEGIPSDHVAFSVDGAYVYWVDAVASSDQSLSSNIYRARSDGSRLTTLAVLSAILVNFSPDRTMLLYFDGSAVWVSRVDGSGAHSLVQAAAVGWPPAVWRPKP